MPETSTGKEWTSDEVQQLRALAESNTPGRGDEHAAGAQRGRNSVESPIRGHLAAAAEPVAGDMS
jgi:hypothetical protein